MGEAEAMERPAVGRGGCLPGSAVDACPATSRGWRDVIEERGDGGGAVFCKETPSDSEAKQCYIAIGVLNAVVAVARSSGGFARQVARRSCSTEC